MMKYRFFCIAVSLCIWMGTAWGSPVGNIADPACLSSGVFTHERPNGIFAGMEADFSTDRDYQLQTGDITLNTYGTRIGAILGNNIMIYGFAGVSEYEDNKYIISYYLPDSPDRSEAVNSLKIATDPDFVYGAGITAVMYEHKVNEGVFLRIGLDVNYRRLELEDTEAVMYHTVYNHPDPTNRGRQITPNVNYTLRLDDYQGALSLSYQVDNFVPYFGFLVMESRGNETIEVPNDDYYYYNGDILLEQNKGYFVGISYNYSNKLSLNVEARNRSESAITCRVLVRF
ncbi:MAG: hypothetical protein ACOZF0_08765 [Thermodesulfobacteriota bacterium]